MPLDLAIKRAASILGSQQALADSMGEPHTHISAWKTGKRTCTIDKRIKIAQIAGMDPTQAVLEGLAAQLDENDEWQGKAKETLNAILNAFPEPEPVEMKVNTWRRQRHRQRMSQIVFQYRVQPGIFSPGSFCTQATNHYERHPKVARRCRLGGTTVNHRQHGQFLLWCK